jgi:hypothetical protein
MNDYNKHLVEEKTGWLHTDTLLAVESVDAAIFTGDGGGEQGLEYLKEHCERWLRGIKASQECIQEVKDEETPEEREDRITQESLNIRDSQHRKKLAFTPHNLY